MIERKLKKIIMQRLFKGKAIIILGPRQSGKTTLLNEFKSISLKKTLMLNCDDPDVKKQLSDATSTQLKQFLGSTELLLIDEAQRVKNVGLTLKLITDQIPEIQIIATGSSAFELTDKVTESLTGRKYEYFLLPISTNEMLDYTSFLEEKRLLNHRLVYGMYPDVISAKGQEVEILKNLSGSYLYKDIFSFQQIRKPEIIELLLEALALQIASEVNYNELAQFVKADVATISRYINLLEKSFVIFRLRSLSRNMRNELKKSHKIYFYDNGIRNAIISNFNPVELRNDIGQLWENFLVSERLKFIANNNLFLNQYFWRTKYKQEIDYIEDYDGKLHAYEFKWNPNKKVRFSKTFTQGYPGSETKVITTENYHEFLTD